jgi:hypothetical protein
MPASVKIGVNKLFEVYLLDIPFLLTKDLFLKMCGREVIQ